MGVGSLIRNQQVIRSNRIVGSINSFFFNHLWESTREAPWGEIRRTRHVLVLRALHRWAPTGVPLGPESGGVRRGFRWKLRRAVRVVNQVLTGLRLEKAPEKTFIGRVERGFDFLGYRLSPDGITVAEATWKRFCERALRLYERDLREPCGPPRLDVYVRRWYGWALHPVQPGRAEGPSPFRLRAPAGRSKASRSSRSL